MRPNRRYSRAGDRMRWRLNPSKGRRLPGAVSFRVKAVSLSTRERQTKSSKPRAGAEAEALGHVVALLDQRYRVIDAERSERRIPDQAGAGGDARLRGIRRPVAVARVAALAAQAARKNRRRKGRRSLVAPHVAGVDEHRGPEARILGNAGDRRLQLGGRARETRAADVVVAGSRGEIPRAEAVGGKAAHQPRPAEECLEDRHALAAEPRHVAGLDAAHRDDVAEHVVVIARVRGRLDEILVAPDPGDVLVELGVYAAGGIAVVV